MSFRANHKLSPRRATSAHAPRSTRAIALFAALTVGGTGLAVAAGAAANNPGLPEYRTIAFPVQEAVSYTDSWGACRGANCSRRHQGQDLIGKRMSRLLSAVAGTVTKLQIDTGGSAGNYVVVTDAAGWSYWYMHVNNDTPGTDDGLNPPAYRFAPGIVVGSKVKAGQHIAYMGDSGNAEFSTPHLHFEQHRPSGVAINPWASLRLAQGLAINTTWCSAGSNPSPTEDPTSAKGLLAVDKFGVVRALGSATNLGDTSKLKLWGPMLGVRASKTSKGYYLIARDGGVFTYGDARFFGSTGGMKLNAPIAGITPTPTGKGYWLYADDGGIFSFGDAAFQGSGYSRLGSATAVGMTPTPTGKGYWIAASDGRVLNFGDAPAAPITTKPNSVVRAIVATKTGDGYWLVADNGTVIAAGDAKSYGSPARSGLCNVNGSMAITVSSSGKGYWVAQANGTILNFGDALDFGSVNATSPVVALESVR